MVCRVLVKQEEFRRMKGLIALQGKEIDDVIKRDGNVDLKI